MFTFKYTADIVNQIARISSLQSQIEGMNANMKSFSELAFRANVEAVHFSTKIEGNRLTLKQVTEILGKKKLAKPDRSLKEVINYSKARAQLSNSVRRTLNHELIHQIHNIVLNGIVIKSHRGKYRSSQNVIKDSASGSIVYMPPEALDVKDLMDKMLKQTAKLLLTDNALIAAAYFHFGFATIHPFMDGNGRVARLIAAFLLQQGHYNLNQFAALEKQHEKNRQLYYESLHRFQGNNFYDISSDLNITGWIQYFLDCVLAAYTEALQTISSQSELPNVDIEDRLGVAYSLFKKYKKLKTKDYELLVSIGRTQAVDDLNQLIKKGLIEKIGGGRSTVYKIKTNRK